MSLFITPENVTIPLVFWCFKGCRKWSLAWNRSNISDNHVYLKTHISHISETHISENTYIWKLPKKKKKLSGVVHFSDTAGRPCRLVFLRIAFFSKLLYFSWFCNVYQDFVLSHLNKVNMKTREQCILK